MYMVKHGFIKIIKLTLTTMIFSRTLGFYAWPKKSANLGTDARFTYRALGAATSSTVLEKKAFNDQISSAGIASAAAVAAAAVS